MAMLGNVFLNTVYDENISGSVKTTDHPIEGGVKVTDHIEKDAKTLDISGVLTGPDATTRKKRLEKYRDSGQMIKYTYRNAIKNVVITSIDETYDAEISNGFKFDISLKEIRVSKAAIVKLPPKAKPKSNKGLQQPSGTKKTKIHIVKRGDTLWDIAIKYYKKPTWQKIYNKNKGVIGRDPDLIYPNQRLIIPA